MIRRLAIFQIILLGGLSLIYALPKSPPQQGAALNTKLPNHLVLSGWEGKEFGVPSEVERKTLAKDTQFFRRDYHREVTMTEQAAPSADGRIRYNPGLVDVLNASIVLSGKDLSQSIHALERCLTAQGFNIEGSTMLVTLRSGHVLPVRRLLCEKAEPGRISHSIAYYWFVGHDYVTSNHVKRGLKDFMDRIFKGYDQRWGYITVTAQLDPGPVLEMVEGSREPTRMKIKFGDKDYDLVRRGLTGEKADELVQEFIGDLGPDLIRVDEIKEWPNE